MTKKLVLVLFLLVCLPLILVGWVGVRLARDEQETVAQRFRDVLTENLRETDEMVSRFFERRERELSQLTEGSSFETADLRQIVSSHPLVSQLFLVDAEGRLLHPPLAGPLSQAEREFLDRARPFLLDKDVVRGARAAAGENGGSGSLPTVVPRQGGSLENQADADEPPAPTQGWLVWYWGRGLNLIFWRRLATGHVVGIELDRSRWMADLISDLPDTSSIDGERGSHLRMGLSDSNDNLVYQWGTYEAPDDAEPLVTLPVSEPLAAWRLSCYVSLEHRAALSGRSVYFNLIAGLSAVALVLLGLGIYFYRELSREIREAATRVNFVNQVSHELRTPLTNIRLYADLLQRDLEGLESDEAGAARQRLSVIASESQRLSRLIGNVLTFARQQRGQVALHLKTLDVDAAIRTVVRQFEPTLGEKGVDVDFQPGPTEPVQCDADVLEQVLVNLLSNVEKYAADGGQVLISSSRRDEITTILVADKGPGIPAGSRQRVFEPFFRLSDRLEGTAGTGIGLAIVRQLARLHGGDATVVDSDGGATFRVDLRTPGVEKNS